MELKRNTLGVALPSLNKRRSNYSLIRKKQNEEQERGIHMLGGEVGASADIQSSSADYNDISTVDKNEQNSGERVTASRHRLNKSSSRSKLELFI